MSQNDDGSSDREARLQAALVEYLDALQAGNAPDRKIFLAQYPELTDDLSEFLSNREKLDELVVPLRDAAKAQLHDSDAEAVTIAPTSALPPHVGSKVHYFGDYELLDEIARGGMGVVYKARQVNLKRIVALKMILSGRLAGEEDVRRFHAEAEAAAKLDHPGIVPIFEVGQHEGQHYFSMAFVDGQSLARQVAEGPLPPRDAAELTKKVVEAVAYAHVEGVIHRDLKPANILIDKDGQPRVTDFGLAKQIPPHASLMPGEASPSERANSVGGMTATGQILGTPGYMAPEQAGGVTGEVGPLSDVYSLGAVLYCLLTGRPPFQAANLLDTLIEVMNHEPVAPRQLNRSVPRDLETICLKCLEKEPPRRYASAPELAEDINRYLNDEPIRARRVGHPERLRRWVWKRRRVVAAMAVTGCVALVLAALFFSRSSEELIAAADELHVANKHREAVELYRKALFVSSPWRANEYSRFHIRERMVRCYQELGDTDGVVETALEMLEFDPDAWFGEHNLAVAEAVISQIRTRHSSFRDAASKDRAQLELAEKRIEFFLNGPYGTDMERQVSQATLIEIRIALGSDPGASSQNRDQLAQLPSGTPEELLRLAGDTQLTAMKRAAAAYAAGLRLGESGDARAALSAYEQSFELLRSANPIYAGIGPHLDTSRPRSLRLEPWQCRMLRQVGHQIRRVDPAQPDHLRGGLRFRIVGLDLPPDFYTKLSLSLEPVDFNEPIPGTDAVGRPATHNPLGSAPVQLDQTAWVGVADGRYKLSVRQGPIGTSSSESRGARARRVSELLELDFSDLPQEVEIRGATVELPPIRARLVNEITLLAPAESANVDLQTNFFRWAKVPGANSYGLHFALRIPIVGGVRWEPVHTVSSETTSVCLATLAETDVERLSALTPESTITWSVEAFDVTGRSIARTLAKRNFRVGRSLTISHTEPSNSD